jgi:CRISPR/Cas system-associated protein Cas5 (RAMP superfamily)
MSGYSYSEIQNMQQKAMARVREMKRTSDEITKVAQKEFDYQYKDTDTNNHKPTITAKITNMPPNFPKVDIYSDFKEYFKAEQEKTPVKQNTPKQESNPNQSTIQTFFDEPDKALLLGLIMLLKSEKADESLIMALTYILS